MSRQQRSNHYHGATSRNYPQQMNRYASSTRTGPPAIKYTPIDIKLSRLNANLGIPGYFPHTGRTQDEEQMTVLNVVNGYHNPNIVNDEYGTFLQRNKSTGSTASVHFQNNMEEATNHIIWLGNFKLSWQYQEPPKDSRRGRVNDDKFPKQVAVSKSAQNEFMQRLSSPESLLQHLANGIPHGYKGEYLITELAQHAIPMLRATWFIKVVQLNSQKKSTLNRSQEDWTTTLVNYLIQTTKNLVQYKQLPEQNKIKEAERNDICGKLEYTIRLLHWQYCEQLLEVNKLFDIFMYTMKEIGDFELHILLYVLQPFVPEISRNHIQFSTFVSLLLNKLQMVYHIRTKDTILLASLLTQIKYILCEFPHRLSAANGNELHQLATNLGSFSNSFPPSSPDFDLCSELKEIISTYAGQSTSNKETEETQIPQLLHSLDRVAYNNHTFTQLFDIFKKLYESAKGSEMSLLFEVFKWAISRKKIGIPWRRHIVFSLLNRLSRYINTQNMNPNLIQQSLLAYIQQFKPDGEEEQKEFLLFFSEAQIIGSNCTLFSHEKLSRYIIASGKLTESSVVAESLRRILLEMPVHGKSCLHSQRMMLLQRCFDGYDQIKEQKKIAELKAQLQANFKALATSTDESLYNIILSLEKVPMYSSSLCVHWFYGTLEALDNQTISSCQYQFIVFLFVETKNFTFLTKFLLHAIKIWTNCYLWICDTIQRYIRFFHAQELIDTIVSILVQMNESEKHSPISLKLLGHILGNQFDVKIHQNTKKMAFVMRKQLLSDEHPLRKVSRPADPLALFPVHLLSTPMQPHLVEAKHHIRSLQVFTEVLFGLFCQLVEYFLKTGTPSRGVASLFLIECEQQSDLFGFSLWFCKYVNKELFPICFQRENFSSEALFGSPIPSSTLFYILLDFTCDLIARGFLSMDLFLQTCFLPLVSSSTATADQITPLVHTMILQCMIPEPFQQSPFMMASLRNEIIVQPRQTLLKILFHLHQAGERINIDLSLFEALNKAVWLRSLMEEIPTSTIGNCFLSDFSATATQRRKVFHTLFFGESAFIPFQRESPNDQISLILRPIFTQLDVWNFELVKMGLNYIYDDWKVHKAVSDKEEIYFNLLATQILCHFSTTGARASLYCLLVQSLGDTFQNCFISRTFALLGQPSIILGSDYLFTVIGVPFEDVDMVDDDQSDENENENENEDEVEYQLYKVMKSTIISISSKNHAIAQRLLPDLASQIEAWNTHTKELLVYEETTNVARLQYNLHFRLELLRSCSDFYRLDKFPEQAKKMSCLFLQLCDNCFVLFLDFGYDLFEFVVRLLEITLDSSKRDARAIRVDKSVLQFDRQLIETLRNSFANLTLIDEEQKERLDDALPSLESKKCVIKCTTPDAYDTQKLRENEIDPWTLLEGYHAALLPPVFFDGNIIERSNLTYLKSPFDKPKMEFVDDVMLE